MVSSFEQPLKKISVSVTSFKEQIKSVVMQEKQTEDREESLEKSHVATFGLTRS